MSEDRRLRDKLDKLADDESGAGTRRLSAAGRDLTEAILEEIDETILGRTLAFRAADGATLRLRAANRRLLCLVELPGGQADHAALLAPLGPEDEDALTAVAGAIRAFASGRYELWVTATPVERTPDGGMRGRSAAAVAQALGLTLYARPAPVPMPDPAKGFDAGLARLASAVATASGEAPSPATGPDADAVGRLSGLDRKGLQALAKELGPARAGKVLLMTAGEETLLVAARSGGRVVLALLPAERAGMAVALWSATGGE